MKVTTVILIITKEDGDGRKRGDGSRSSLTPGSCPCKELWSKPTYHKVIMRMMIRTRMIIMANICTQDSGQHGGSHPAHCQSRRMESC